MIYLTDWRGNCWY